MKQQTTDNSIFELIRLAATAEEKYYTQLKESLNNSTSSSLNLNYKYLINELEHKQKKRDLMRSFIGVAAAFALIYIIINPSQIAQAARKIFEWGKHFVEFQFTTENTNREVPRFSAEYIPAGYNLVSESYDGLISNQYYEKGNDSIEVTISLLSAGFDVNSENVKVEEFIQNRTTIYYLESQSEDYYSSMFIVDKERQLVTCIITPYSISKEESLKILDNIQYQ